MATIVTRAGKGAPLTTAELDANFTNLNSGKVEVGGALGTPSSGTVTNLTGTASININGTVGATTPNAGAFTTLSSAGQTRVKGAISTNETGLGFGYSGASVSVLGAWGGGGATRGILSFYLADQAGTIGNEYMRLTDTGLSVAGTLTASGAITNSAGTANGVAYLNGSKVLTTGSALGFDGTYLTANGLRIAGADTTNTIYQATGALGISTGSAAGILLSTNGVVRQSISAIGETVWAVSGTEVARLSSSTFGIFTVGTEGPVVGIGTNYGTLGAWGSAGGGIKIARGTGAPTDLGYLYADSTGMFLQTAGAVPLVFGYNGAEVARATADGFGIGGAAVYKLDAFFDQNSANYIRARNSNAGSSAYAGLVVNAYGNSWAWRMGSTAANSNRLELVLDAVGTPAVKLAVDTGGNLGIKYATPGDFTSVNASDLVVGNGAANAGMTIYGAAAGYSSIAFADGTGVLDQYAGLIQYSHITNALNIFTNATLKMVLDGAGNLGLGVTPSAWGAGGFLELPGARGISAQGSQRLFSNAYDNSGLKYITSDEASYYIQENGAHLWASAPSGTAGAAITFAQVMSLTANGCLIVGQGARYNDELFSIRAAATSGAPVVIQNTSAGRAAILLLASDNGIGGAISATTGATYGLKIDSTNNLELAIGGAECARWDASGNLIQKLNASAPTLGTNSTMTFELTSNTSLTVKVRGSDGTTRSVSLTLA